MQYYTVYLQSRCEVCFLHFALTNRFLQITFTLEQDISVNNFPNLEDRATLNGDSRHCFKNQFDKNNNVSKLPAEKLEKV